MDGKENGVADITYIATADGWLYLACVLDLYSRSVVGRAMGEQINAPLVQAALQMAFQQRHPKAGLLHHSDQGSQFISAEYRACLATYQVEESMSRVGNCHGKAVMESFFATLKAECATQPFAGRAQARTAIFEYIEAGYNRVRLHSSLGYRGPMEFEQSGHLLCPQKRVKPTVIEYNHRGAKAAESGVSVVDGKPFYLS